MFDCAAAPPTRLLGRPLERNDCLQPMRGLATLSVLIGDAMYIVEQRYNAEGYELRRFQLGETLIEPFSFCHSEDFLVNTKNIRVMPNDSDVIQAAMVEILDRLDGTAAGALRGNAYGKHASTKRVTAPAYRRILPRIRAR
jgi:hypothetical protein